MSESGASVGLDVRLCAQCGYENSNESRFCARCGARLAHHAPREERKLVSVLFVDLVDFTARAERADPEDVRELLALYHAESKRRIEQYGGVVEKFIGDAVMAVFGAPVAHGDDAERAVRAGLRVLEGVDELNEAHGLGLAARAAVNTGEAVVSVEAGPGEALATGDIVNTASRLQSAAPAGRLIVGAETHRATRQAIRYEAAEPVRAKGKMKGVSAWLAVEPELEPAERALAAGVFVGRRRELEHMHSLWSRCVGERRPHLVTVMGPPGIGKSRLCRELSELVRAERGRILRGRCLPYEEQVGYQAFPAVVRGASRILDSDATAVARAKLQRTVEEVMPEPEVPDTFRYLALLLGLAPDDEVPQPGLLFFAARRFLEQAGLAQPTVFLFEDVHWAQPSELALLEYLVQHLRDSSLMLVATARPELADTRPTWGSGFLAQTTIPLEPLAPGDAQMLVSELVDGGATIDVARLVEVAEGNPLFLEELAASVADLDASDELPVTVREAIAARIDVLPVDARRVLLSAAVIGKTFWRGALQAIGGSDDVDDALRLLEARDLVRRDASSELSGDLQYSFKHMLIREVAYGTLPRAERRDRHAAVARYVEAHLGDASETLSTILAHHWREAGEPARAIPYLLTAADAARRSWAKEALVELYSRALELAEDSDLRRRIRLQRAVALVDLADYPRAAEEFESLLPELEGEERLDALLAYGHATLWTERDADTLVVAEEALALVNEVGDETALGPALAMESQALAMRGDAGDLDRAIDVGDRALEVWVPETRALDLRHHLHLHADAKYWVGQYEESLALSRRLRGLARDLQSPEARVRGAGFEAVALAGLGRHEEAIAIWDGLVDIARDLDQNPRFVLNCSALAYRELHDVGEARRRSEEALELSVQETFGMPRQFAGSDLLLTQLLAGDVGGAQTAWPRLWREAEHATGWTTWLIAGRLTCARAEIALHAETPESCVEWATKALDVARRTRRRKYEGRSLTVLGQALARLGRREEALESLRAGVAIADDLVGPPARWHARAALGEAAYALGDDETAASAYGEAARLIEDFAATLTPERGARLLAAPAIAETLAAVGHATHPE